MFADPRLRTQKPVLGRRGWGFLPQPEREPPLRPRRGSLRAWLRLGAIAGALLLAGGGGLIAFEATHLPDTGQLLGAQRKQSVTILGTDGSTVATFGDIYGEPLHLTEMSKYLPEAVVSTEDRRFYDHFGIDPVGVLRALWVDIRTGNATQGGSTITQQLAKNLFLGPDRTLERKVREALLALWLEHRFTKDQLLEIYLNRVYLGAGAYGVDGAARRYFGKSARDLTPYQAAVIAGLLKAPSRYSPAHDRGLADARARQVLANMREAGWLSDAQVAMAEQEGARPPSVAVSRPGSRYFADWLSEQLTDQKAEGDLVVRSTLDPRLQALAEKVMGDALAKAAPALGASQGALVALSPDGAVRAMVGGRDYGESQFNRATQAERQPGSAFKPFVYLTALEKGLKPTDVFSDAPLRINGWQPRNFENRYEGDVTMAEAVAQSLNTVAVQVGQKVGLQNVIATAHRLGITAALSPDPSLALGSGEVTLLELTAAYAPFATGGEGAWPYGMTEVGDGRTTLVWQRSGGGPGRLVAPEIAGEMSDMLAGVIQHGTGKAAQIGRPAAGKSGTTSDSRDAWFIGYTPDLIVGVWFGNDDNSPTRNMTGGSLPAKTWRDFMAAALQGSPVRPLPSGAQSTAAAPLPTDAGPAPSPVNLDGLFAAVDRDRAPARQEPVPRSDNHLVGPPTILGPYDRQ